MAGPLPNPNRRRRNQPTIPFTELPARGRPGPVPKVPRDVKLGKLGEAWWKRAWKTPQATIWLPGSLDVVCRRAQLQDLFAAAVDEGRPVTPYLAAMTTLDDKLGLTPKGLRDMRLSIVEEAVEEPTVERVDDIEERTRALYAVEDVG